MIMPIMIIKYFDLSFFLLDITISWIWTSPTAAKQIEGTLEARGRTFRNVLQFWSFQNQQHVKVCFYIKTKKYSSNLNIDNAW